MIKKIFAPGKNSAPANLGLLVLRLWIGLTMCLAHGLDKLRHFSAYSSHFPDPFHIGSSASLSLSVFAEFFASLLLVIGLVSRFASVVLIVNMCVAFFIVMKGAIHGDGELAFVYLMAYVVLLLTGPGNVSLDKVFFGKSAKSGWGAAQK